MYMLYTYLYIDMLHTYLCHTKNEILPFSTICLDLYSIMLTEINQIKTNIVSYHLYVESKNQNAFI